MKDDTFHVVCLVLQIVVESMCLVCCVYCVCCVWCACTHLYHETRTAQIVSYFIEKLSLRDSPTTSHSLFHYHPLPLCSLCFSLSFFPPAFILLWFCIFVSLSLFLSLALSFSSTLSLSLFHYLSLYLSRPSHRYHTTCSKCGLCVCHTLAFFRGVSCYQCWVDICSK